MTPQTEPTTDQEWIVAALELRGWKLQSKKFSGNRTGFRYELDGRGAGAGLSFFGWGWHSTVESAKRDLPDLRSVDACLKHLVPVMKKKGFRLELTVSVKGANAAFAHPLSHSVVLSFDPDLALAIVKAFVRAMKGEK